MNQTEVEQTQPIPAPPTHEMSWWKKSILKIDSFLERKPFEGSFLVALFLVVPILVFFKFYFQLCDDIYALFLLKGTVLTTAPIEFNFEENSLLCLALKSLYLSFPNIQWYGGLFVIMLFLSVWGMLFALHLGADRFLKTCLFIVGSAVTVERFFIPLQWTSVAAAAGIGGLMLLAALWRREDSKFLPSGLCLSFVLIMASALIRFDALLLIALLSVPVAVFFLLKLKLTPARRTILVFLAMTTLLSVAALEFDRYSYSQDPAWEGSVSFFKQVRWLNSFQNLAYTEGTKPFFDSIGWTENDLNLFKNNYFMDPGTYSAEKIRRVNDHFSEWTFDKNPQGTFGMMFSNPFTVVELVFFFIALLFIPAGSFGFAFLYLAWVFLVLLFFRLFLWIPERIYMPCLFALTNVAVFLSASKFGAESKDPPTPSRSFKWGVVLSALFFIFSLVIYYYDQYDNRYWTDKEAKLKSTVADLNPQDDQLFVVWGSSFPYIEIGAFDDDEWLKKFHVVSVDWFQRTPATRAMMDRFGVKDLFKDLVNNPKAFLICTPGQWYLYQVYMKEKYNEDVKFKFYFRSDQFAALSIYR